MQQLQIRSARRPLHGSDGPLRRIIAHARECPLTAGIHFSRGAQLVACALALSAHAAASSLGLGATQHLSRNLECSAPGAQEITLYVKTRQELPGLPPSRRCRAMCLSPSVCIRLTHRSLPMDVAQLRVSGCGPAIVFSRAVSHSSCCAQWRRPNPIIANRVSPCKFIALSTSGSL